MRTPAGTSHNPPSRAFVEACDRFGVILMVEAFDTVRPGPADRPGTHQNSSMRAIRRGPHPHLDF